MVQDILAACVVAVCAFLLVRLGIGERRRSRLDRWLTRRWGSLRQAGASLSQRWQGRRRRRALEQEAAESAAEAIRRAHGGSWDGNVYRPKSFKKPRKPH